MSFASSVLRVNLRLFNSESPCGNFCQSISGIDKEKLSLVHTVCDLSAVVGSVVVHGIVVQGAAETNVPLLAPASPSHSRAILTVPTGFTRHTIVD